MHVLRRQPFRGEQEAHRLPVAAPQPGQRPGRVGVVEDLPEADRNPAGTVSRATSAARPGSSPSTSIPIRQMPTLVGPKYSPIVVVSPVRTARSAASAAHDRLSSGRFPPRLAYAQTSCNEPSTAAPPGRPACGRSSSTARPASASPRSYEPQAFAAPARAYAAYPRNTGSPAASAASRHRSAASHASAGCPRLRSTEDAMKATSHSSRTAGPRPASAAAACRSRSRPGRRRTVPA